MILNDMELLARSRFELPYNYCANHVLLASYPKSGNTWFRFIVSNVNKILSNSSFDVDFHTIGKFTPAVRGNRNLAEIIEVEGYPTFLKTHFPYVSGFSKYKSVLIVRNPIDVMASYFHYMNNEKGRVFENPSKFIRHWRYGMPAWLHFHKRWYGHADVIIKYEDLLLDVNATVANAYVSLGCHLSDEVLVRATSMSTKEKMRLALSEKGDPESKNKNYQFVRVAQFGSGAKLFNDEDIDYINLVKIKLGF